MKRSDFLKALMVAPLAVMLPKAKPTYDYGMSFTVRRDEIINYKHFGDAVPGSLLVSDGTQYRWVMPNV